MQNTDFFYKLSNKENINALINEFGNIHTLTYNEEYVYLKVNEIWKTINESELCSENKINSIYIAVAEVFTDIIGAHNQSYFSNCDMIHKIINNFYVSNIEILSSKVLNVSIKKYYEVIKKGNDGEENFIKAIKCDFELFLSIFSQFTYWTDSLFLFLETTTSYLCTVLNNLKLDYVKIKELLFNNHDFTVNSLILEIGDKHNGEFVIQFSTNIGKLFYKPRNSDVDTFYEKICRHITTFSDRISDMEYIINYSLPDHSWSKEVKYCELKSAEEEKKYYKVLGQQLAFLHVLNGNDIHFENIISSSEYPIIIDLETILTSRLNFKNNLTSEILRDDKNNYQLFSVKDIGILPHYIMQHGVVYDLGSMRNTRLGNQQNTADLHRIERFIKFEEIKEHFLIGFKEVYDTVCNNKEEVLQAFEKYSTGLVLRYLNRPTYIYSQIKQTLLNPISFFDYHFSFAITTRLYLDDLPNKIDLYEQKDLLLQNIPKFEVMVNGKELYWRGKSIDEDFFLETIEEGFKKKIDTLGRDDYKLQLKVCEYTLKALDGLNLFESNKVIDKPRGNDKLSDFDLNRRLESKYHNIIECLINDSLIDPISGKNIWIGYQLLSTEYQTVILPPSFYSSTLGIIYLLSKDKEYKNSSFFKKLVKDNLDLMNDYMSKIDSSVLSGAYEGIGMYVKFVQNLFIENVITFNVYKSNMLILFDTIMSFVDKGDKNDILNGSAGLLITVVNVYEKTTDSEIRTESRKIVEKLYDHLIASINVYGNDHFINTTQFKNQFYTGYAHGTSGILVAIYKAMKILNMTNDVLIKSMLDTERKYFDKQLGVFYKSNFDKDVSWGWCHGMPGILLSRTELFRNGYVDSVIVSEMNDMIDICIEKALGHGLTFCHGDMGVISIIENAFTVIEKDDRLNVIKKYKEQLFKNIVLTDKLYTVRGTESPGLMDGMAGVAYFIKQHLRNDNAADVLTLLEV